jgi:hypothetical protein
MRFRQAGYDDASLTSILSAELSDEFLLSLGAKEAPTIGRFVLSYGALHSDMQ